MFKIILIYLLIEDFNGHFIFLEKETGPQRASSR